ncbi:hypothetical protein KI688_006635 [Linnemannia hyalina]|uniref:F-box domain-containing protein n=1 Tax=Linnemannia hyalina TaxID=64524 RepID=A0A9P7XL37_9FUNG|nr:hypothetical protein KI688_006635 [Linnemannia hyalina]
MMGSPTLHADKLKAAELAMSAVSSITTPPLPVSVKALDIPEIASLVGQHLSKIDLASCALVAHIWFQVFTPLVWKSIEAGRPISSRHHDHNDRDDTHRSSTHHRLSLSKYGAFIRTLAIIPEPENTAVSDLDLIFECPAVNSLVQLTVNLERGASDTVGGVVRRNQDTLRLLKLVFQMDKRQRPPGWLGERMFEFPTVAPCLQSLFLEYWCMSKRELVLILKGCLNLKLLSFGNITILDREDEADEQAVGDNDNCGGAHPSNKDILGDTDEDFQHQSIETFRMCSRLCPILEYLPKIKLLEFYRFDRQIKDEELERFCASLRTHCPDIQDIWAYGFECSMLPAILDSLPRLVNFRGSSDLPTVLSMLDHALTLEEANLSDYTERTFLPLQFLESCPRLRTFWTGHSLTTMDEVQHSLKRGWACQLTLEELRLSIFKLTPVLIEAIMQELNAERATDSRQQRASRLLAARGDVTLEEYERQKEQQLQDAILALSPEQQVFRRQFTAFLVTLDKLKRLNFGTGWYSLARRLPSAAVAAAAASSSSSLS